jgi:hypothetical protein
MKTRGNEVFLTVSILAILFGMPIVQVVYELAQGERPQVLDVAMQAPTEKNLRDFESNLEESSWVAQAVRPRLRQWHFAALRDPGNQVLMGRNGWLFYKPGVDYLVQSSDEASQDNGPVAAIAAIVQFRDQLQRQGIKLLVVPVPGKASVYPDRLTGRNASSHSSLRSPTLDVIDRLREQGVETVDLFAVFQRTRETEEREVDGAMYLALDTHWSPRGVRIAAEAIAERIHRLEWLAPGEFSYKRNAVETRRDGDIVRMMQLPKQHRFYKPEKVRCQQVVRQQDSLVYQDQPSSPVLLLGDSFSRIYQSDEPSSAGLIAQLAYELGMPLTSIINDGGASTLVRQNLGRRPELLRGKKLVIWQFVERDIRFGTEGWKSVPIGEVDDL